MNVQCLVQPKELDEINMKLDRIIVMMSRLSEQRATVPVSRAPASVPRRTALRHAPSLSDLGGLQPGSAAVLDFPDQPPEEPDGGDGDTCMEGGEDAAPKQPPAEAAKGKKRASKAAPKRSAKRAAPPSPVLLSEEDDDEDDEDDDFVVKKEPAANY